MLRRRDYRGSIVMLSNDTTAPVDRPNLSKDYLAGSAPEDWLPLRPDAFYPDNEIELRLNCEVLGINVHTREVMIAGNDSLTYDRLLLAAGAEPALSVPEPTNHMSIHCVRWRTRAIIEATKGARRARRRRKFHRT